MGSAALAVAALAVFGTPVTAGAPAGAAVSAVGSPCGFHVGPPLETGALGTFGFEFPLFPADPHQVCRTVVTARASYTPTAGGSYVNVGNPGTVTATVSFTGGPLPPGMLWTWSPHCADPAATGVFTLTVDGQSASSKPQAPRSCYPDLGGHSGLAFLFVDPAFTTVTVGMAATTDGDGYWVVTASGDVLARGDAATPGLLPPLNQPAVGVVADPSGHGYWVVAGDGGVLAFDGAPFRGSLGAIHLNAPIVGMVATPGGLGYWLVGADGGVFAFGDARYHGSLGGLHLNAPVVAMAATPDGGGYWLAAYDGGVFALGDATYEGSAAAAPLAAPVFGMAATPSGKGYWLLGGDGGIFTYGDAPFHGTAYVE